jgi:hypothetical protein
LYGELTAKILINGHLSRGINILRGVKQGDALSSMIFIVCIDPLVRNLNADNEIKIIELQTNISKKYVDFV